MRIFLRLCSVVFGATVFCGSCLAEEPKTLQELVERIAIEREKLIQFSVECRLRGSVDILGFERHGARELVARIEYCRPEKHYMVCVSEGGSAWQFSGASGELTLSGSSDKKLVATPRHLMLPLAAHRSNLIYFDPRVTGIASCGDTLRRTAFESVIGNYLLWKADLSKEVRIGNEGLLEFDHESSDLTLRVDPKRGYWPTFYSFHPGQKAQTWNVELKESRGMWLPESATIKCNGKSVDVMYIWSQINEAVVGGDASAKRIAENFGTTVVRPSIEFRK